MILEVYAVIHYDYAVTALLPAITHYFEQKVQFQSFIVCGFSVCVYSRCHSTFELTLAFSQNLLYLTYL